MVLEELSIRQAVDKKLIRIIKPNELEFFKNPRKYLSTSSIDENGINQVEAYITYDNRPSRANMKPIEGSVWFAKMKNSIKVFRSLRNDENEYILSTGFYGIKSITEAIDPAWLEQLFKSDYFNNQKDKFSEGSSMSGVKDSQLSDIKIKIFKNYNYGHKCIQLMQYLEKNYRNNLLKLKLLSDQKEYLLSNLFI